MGEQWQMLVSVLVLVACLMFAAAVVRRYQEFKAKQRAMVRRLVTVAAQIETALDELQGVPTSKELRSLFRDEVLQRLQRAQQTHAGLEGIEERIAAAAERLRAEGPPMETRIMPIEQKPELTRMHKGIDTLAQFLGKGTMLNPPPTDQRDQFVRELLERRAEAFARYHLAEAENLHRREHTAQGRQHLQALIEHLQERGPNTDFVRDLHRQAMELYQEYSGVPGRGSKPARNTESMPAA